MKISENEIKELLDEQVKLRNTIENVTQGAADPLRVAMKHKDPYIALICALFAYGNANQIVKFLEQLDFNLLDRSESEIKEYLAGRYYRFQKTEDVINIFIAIRRFKQSANIEKIVYDGYLRGEGSIVAGLSDLIAYIRSLVYSNTHGYNFLVGKEPKDLSSFGAYKRYMMYFRWMVRDEQPDLGLWSKIDKSSLIMPLDTHTFNVSHKLGLLKRKSCDLKAAIELTKKLKEFDGNDPLKYDFALYRIGQSRWLQQI